MAYLPLICLIPVKNRSEFLLSDVLLFQKQLFNSSIDNIWGNKAKASTLTAWSIIYVEDKLCFDTFSPRTAVSRLRYRLKHNSLEHPPFVSFQSILTLSQLRKLAFNSSIQDHP